MNRRVDGFTMVEVMVTIAVVAILAGIAAPSMIAFVRDSRLRGVSGQLFTDLQFARSEAIRRNRPVLLCAVAGCAVPTGNWAGGWQVCVDADDDLACDVSSNASPNPLRSRAALDSSVTLTGSTTGLSFRPDGSQGAVGGAAKVLTLSGTWTSPPNYQHTTTSTGVIALIKQ